ncbi:uncharacterized protein LOC131614125 [Vicia villosa]|uniref:uncharacterized protein LOC131614125 n=1 Tax=Vicia villosa TaxID=3911 RepID=UPI00273B2856|nr:uncharacterized protein LOC131614125 [Vicia villosa]
MVVNEVVDYANKEGRSYFLFKVDFEKAYNKVNWNFLSSMLKKMEFGALWMKWIDLLIFQSKISILVNESPTKELKVERVAEGLTGLVTKAIYIGEFEGFLFNGKCKVDILQFTDDTLLIGEGIRKQVWAIKTVLKAFEMVSGFGINYHKSKLIGINVSSNLLEAASSLLSCTVEGKVLNGEVLNIVPSFSSSWWKDILSLGKNSHHDVMINSCTFNIDRGFTTSFWHSVCISDLPLKDCFPSLYYVSKLERILVAGMGVGGRMFGVGGTLGCSGIGRSLFFKCSIVKLIWKEIAEWIGMSDVKVEDPKGSFMYWYNSCKHMKMKEGKLSCIWLASTWNIWLLRNDILFRKDP